MSMSMSLTGDPDHFPMAVISSPTQWALSTFVRGPEARRPAAGADNLRGLGLTPKEVYHALKTVYGPQEPEPVHQDEAKAVVAEPAKRMADAEAQAGPASSGQAAKGGVGSSPGKFPKNKTFVDRRHCYVCKKPGHIAKDCRKARLHKGYSSESVASGASSNWSLAAPALPMPNPNQLAAMMAMMAGQAGRHFHIHIPAEQPAVFPGLHPGLGWQFQY